MSKKAIHNPACTHTHARTHASRHASMHIHTCTHTCTHSHAHSHARMHASTHTNTHFAEQSSFSGCLITEQCNTRICQCPVAPSAICVFRIVVIFIKTFYWLLCIALSYYLVALLSSGTTISCGDYYLI